MESLVFKKQFLKKCSKCGQDSRPFTYALPNTPAMRPPQRQKEENSIIDKASLQNGSQEGTAGYFWKCVEFYKLGD